MSFKEDIKKYMEPTWGCVANKANPPDHDSDNANLFSATYLVLSGDKDYLPIFTRFVDANTIQPGLYRRYPGVVDFNSHDDLTGIAVAAYHFGLPYAKDILSYGQAHHWSFDTEHPGNWSLRSWLRRIPDFVPTIKAAAGRSLNLLDAALFSVALLANCFEKREETSGKCLIYLKQVVVYGKHWLSNLAIKLWRFRMSKLYPGGMREVYSIYFGSDHPFSKYGPEDFE